MIAQPRLFFGHHQPQLHRAPVLLRSQMRLHGRVHHSRHGGSSDGSKRWENWGKTWFSYGFLSTWLSGNSMGQFDIFPMRHQKTWRNFITGFLRTQDHSLPIFSGPMHDWLVVSTPLKNGIIVPNIWKNKNCSKPPTR